MELSSFFKRRWKVIINVVTILALIILIYAIRGQLANTIDNLKHINAWVVLLIIPIEFIDYHAQAKLYQKLFAIVGNNLTYKFLFKTSLELNFVNHVFPSGGVTGISYFGAHLRDGEEITGGKATLIQVMKLALTFLSFELLLIFGMIALAVMGRVNSLTILVGGSLSTLLIIGTIVFPYIVGSKQRISSFFKHLTQALNWLIHLVLRNNPESINIDRVEGVFNDFHDNYQQIQKHRSELKAPFMYALLTNIAEVMAIYIFYVAFGKYVNIGAVILAYAVANFAGLVSVLPGGVGVYEALMTTVLLAAGVPVKISIPITIMYRVVNTILQIPPGYVFYQRSLNKNQVIKEPHAQ